MAFTFNDKIEKLKTNRSIAINNKQNLQRTQAEVGEEDEFNNSYLHGDTDNDGFNDLIWYYYKEKEYEKGFEYNPILGDTLNNWADNWEIVLNNSLKVNGDSANGFYPPDINGIAAQEINFLTWYLNLNDETQGDTTSSLNFYFNDVIEKIGDSATDTDGTISGDTYGDTSSAIQAARIFLYGDSIPPGSNSNTTFLGTRIRGRRTSNVEVGDTINPDTSYTIGIENPGADNPNFYADSTADTNAFLGNIAYKTDFLNSFITLLTNGDSDSTYQNHLRNLLNEIDGTNDLINDVNAFASDLGETASNIQSYLNTLGEIFGDSSSGDTWPGETSFWSLYAFFNQADGTEANFDSGLGTIVSLINQGDSLMSGRRNNLQGIIGDSYVSSENDFTNLRKWRNFWVKSRIQKPVSSLIAYNGIVDALDDANASITKETLELQNLLGDTLNNHLEYIPIPTIFASYTNPKRDQDTGIITQRNIETVYDGQQHAIFYRIYRRIADNYNHIVRGDCGDTLSPTIMGETHAYLVNAASIISGDTGSGDSFSRKITKTSNAGAGDAIVYITPDGDSQNLYGAIPGDTYKLSVDLKVPSTIGDSANIILEMRDYQSGWESDTTIFQASLGIFQTISVTRSIRDSATGFNANIRILTGETVTTSIYMDNLKLEKNNLTGNISNNEWSQSGSVVVDFGDTDPETNFASTTFKVYDVQFSSEDAWVFRVQTFDNINTVGGDTTASLQNNLFDSLEGDTFVSDLNNGDSILRFGDSHNFSEGNTLIINDIADNNGYYTITRIGDTTINISPPLSSGDSGTVYKTSSVVFINE